MRKRSFSLIEIIVSLGLLSLLLTTLFSWYHTISRQKENFKQAKSPLIEERYAQQRLQQILPKIESPFFSTPNQDLIFIFDRGPYKIRELSGKLLGRLYFDTQVGALSLSVWPLPKEDEMPTQKASQTYILLDGVENCHFEFYYPPNVLRKTVDPAEVGKSVPFEGWQNEWKKSYHLLPAIVKIIIKREEQKGLQNHSLEYAFDLPVPIVYPKASS